MKTYTEKEVKRIVRDAVTACKIHDAAAITRYAGSSHTNAEMILKGAGITKREVRKYLTDEADQRRLCAIVGSGGVVGLLGATATKSCDSCDSQEGRHYCLLHSIQIKNMDTVRCKDWSEKQPNT